MQTQTHLVVILDRSGSMEIMRLDMEKGFDAFIAEQAKLPDPCVLTLVQFDTLSIDTVLDRVALDKVPKLSLMPRGGTPLLDAIGNTVTGIRPYAKSTENIERTLVIIITDGWENASREWVLGAVKALITQRRAEGWEFMYLGANVNAFAESGALGIRAGTTSGYNVKTVRNTFDAMGAAAVSYRSGLTADIPDAVKEELEKK